MLIGSTFSISLIRRRVVIDIKSQGDLLTAMHRQPWVSFWGHGDTVEMASIMAGADLRPTMERPAIVLSPEGFPMLGGVTHKECWVISPNFEPGYRAPEGQKADTSKIIGWCILCITWEET